MKLKFDLCIEVSQMNEILRTEARTRNAELLAKAERITLLEAATATNRAQPRGRQRIAAAGPATGAAVHRSCGTLVGGPERCRSLLQLPHRQDMLGTSPRLAPAPLQPPLLRRRARHNHRSAPAGGLARQPLLRRWHWRGEGAGSASCCPR